MVQIVIKGNINIYDELINNLQDTIKEQSLGNLLFDNFKNNLNRMKKFFKSDSRHSIHEIHEEKYLSKFDEELVEEFKLAMGIFLDKNDTNLVDKLDHLNENQIKILVEISTEIGFSIQSILLLVQYLQELTNRKAEKINDDKPLELERDQLIRERLKDYDHFKNIRYLWAK